MIETFATKSDSTKSETAQSSNATAGAALGPAPPKSFLQAAVAGSSVDDAATIVELRRRLFNTKGLLRAKQQEAGQFLLAGTPINTTLQDQLDKLGSAVKEIELRLGERMKMVGDTPGVPGIKRPVTAQPTTKSSTFAWPFADAASASASTGSKQGEPVRAAKLSESQVSTGTLAQASLKSRAERVALAAATPPIFGCLV